MVLSPENDRFFAENLYADFGSVGQSLRTLVERFQGLFHFKILNKYKCDHALSS